MKIIVDEGYWRINIYSDKLFQCSFLLNNCDGGFYSKCKTNFKGKLCVDCPSNNNEHYHKSLSGKCEKCLKLNQIILFLLIVWIFIFFLIFCLLEMFSSTRIHISKKFTLVGFIYFLQILVFTQNSSYSIIIFINYQLFGRRNFGKVMSIFYFNECLVIKIFGKFNNIFSVTLNIMFGLIFLIFIAIKVKFQIKIFIRDTYNNLPFIQNFSENLKFIYFIIGFFYINNILKDILCLKINNKDYLMESPNIQCSGNVKLLRIIYLVILILLTLILPFFSIVLNSKIEFFIFSYKRFKMEEFYLIISLIIINNLIDDNFSRILTLNLSIIYFIAVKLFIYERKRGLSFMIFLIYPLILIILINYGILWQIFQNRKISNYFSFFLAGILSFGLLAYLAIFSVIFFYNKCGNCLKNFKIIKKITRELNLRNI